MFPKSSIHVHSRFCDGEGEPEDYERAARERGFVSLGFSSHVPLPYPNDWAMRPAELPAYLERIRTMKRAAPQGMEIYLGLEIDYIPGLISPRDARFDELGLDFRIGSVHCLGRSADGKFREVDGPPEMLEELLEVDFAGDARALVRAFYRGVAGMLETGAPDLLAHLDLIKKNNRGGLYFSEEENWYREALAGLVPLIAASGTVVEVNTGGLARGKTTELYPAPWLLARLAGAGVPVTVNSDAHRPDQIDAFYPEAVEALRRAGYTSAFVFRAGGWVEAPL